jgi:predicted TPR repeat methyltransferase
VSFRTEAVDYYSENAADFHASYAADPNRLERVGVWKAFLDRYAGEAGKAYDLGCGSGILACEIAGRGIETVGIDGSASMLQIAARMADAKGLTNIRFEQRLLPVAGGSDLPPADLVVSSSVLEYLESLDDALASFRDLMREEGVLIFSVSNADSISRKLVRVVHKTTGRPEYFGLIRNMTSSGNLVETLHRLGLSVLEVEYFGHADRVNRALARFVGPARSSNMLIVAARRNS